MNSHFCLSGLRDVKSLKNALMNLSVNSPDDFQKLLLRLDKTPVYISRASLFERLYDRRVIYGIDGGSERLIPVSDEEALERFAQRCAEDYVKTMQERLSRPFSQTQKPSDSTKENKVTVTDLVNPDLEDVIYRLHRNRAAEAVIFLLEQASPDVRKAFKDNFLSPEELAQRAEVDIEVWRIQNNHLIRGNLGRYAIFARKGDQERLLRFTNQASCVYYLMHLIHRHQHYGFLAPLDLGANKEEFMRLYHEVYDIPQSTLEHRFKDLMYREEDGRRRAGRTRELVYDIRQHVEEALAEFNEASAPYVMTAYRHLSIGQEHIIFKNEELLQYQFK